jgi:hypothetical protein
MNLFILQCKRSKPFIHYFKAHLFFFDVFSIPKFQLAGNTFEDESFSSQPSRRGTMDWFVGFTGKYSVL